MGIEEFKELLDIGDTINKYGKFSPVYLFIYLTYLDPSGFNFIWLIISLIITIGLPLFKSDFSEFFYKSGKAKYKKIVTTNKRAKRGLLLLSAWSYIFILLYTGYLSIIQIAHMIKNNTSDWIMILLVVFIMGTILNLIIVCGKLLKKDYSRVKKMLKPYVMKRMGKIFRTDKKSKRKKKQKDPKVLD